MSYGIQKPDNKNSDEGIPYILFIADILYFDSFLACYHSYDYLKDDTN